MVSISTEKRYDELRVCVCVRERERERAQTHTYILQESTRERDIKKGEERELWRSSVCVCLEVFKALKACGQQKSM